MDLLPFERLKRKVLIKREAESSGQYGHDTAQRPIGILLDMGIINLNKPAGPSSHQVADYVQKILDIKRSGHSGTLDPKVTGVLPLALGRGTRIVQALLTAGKEYVCLMHLHKEVSQSKVHKVMKSFIGKIQQIPPIRSAVKRQQRTREIYYLTIMEIEEKDVLFRVGCQAGTYIRKLCFDIGKKLGMGAHMAQLVRTKAGPFTDRDWVTLHDLKDAYEIYKETQNQMYLRKAILPVEAGVAHLAQVWVLDTAVDSVAHGADLSLPGVARFHDTLAKGEMVAVLTLRGELVCLGEALMDAKAVGSQEKGVAVKTLKVFMDRQVYPKFKKSSDG